jgi:membrane-associated protease RseP (regulator of RpoE activity)
MNPLPAVLNVVDDFFRAWGRSLGDHPFLWFLIFLNAYFLLLYILVKKQWLARLNMSLMGPLLMLKTARGRGILDFLARAPRFFNAYAAIGTVFTFLFMVLMSLLLIVQLPFVFRVPVEDVPSPVLLLGLPGINPIIPLGYGLLALVFAVVVHEFGHGVMSRVYNIRVKTMGLLFLVVPVGAFVEPDEEEIQKAPRKKRIRVYGAGPTTNFFFTILFAVLFSGVLMAAADPAPGAPIRTVEASGPACEAGLVPSWVVTGFARDDPRNVTGISSWTEFTWQINRTQPNTTVYVHVRDPTVPAQFQGTACHNATNVAQGYFPVRPVRCADLYTEELCYANANITGHPDPLNRSVIGVGPFDAQRALSAFTRPFASAENAVTYFFMPFAALSGQFPLAAPFQQFYEVPFEPGLFWFLANSAYWLFWINLMLGLTNALPILPLDGGHMFRDKVGGWIERRRPDLSLERREAKVRRLSLIVTLTLVSLVLLQFIGPYITAFVRGAVGG